MAFLKNYSWLRVGLGEKLSSELGNHPAAALFFASGEKPSGFIVSILRISRKVSSIWLVSLGMESREGQSSLTEATAELLKQRLLTLCNQNSRLHKTRNH